MALHRSTVFYFVLIFSSDLNNKGKARQGKACSVSVFTANTILIDWPRAVRGDFQGCTADRKHQNICAVERISL
jgi:hypothetical protein